MKMENDDIHLCLQHDGCNIGHYAVCLRWLRLVEIALDAYAFIKCEVSVNAVNMQQVCFNPEMTVVD